MHTKPSSIARALLDGVAEGFREMFEGIANGKVSWEGGSAEAARGTTSLESALRTFIEKQ